MPAKKAAKKVAKKAPTRPGKPRKDHTVSLRVDPEMRAFLERVSGGEPYSVVLRKLVREAQERERRGQQESR